MKKFLLIVGMLLVMYSVYRFYNTSINPNPKYTYGQKLDSFNNVFVFYNGNVGHTDGRNTSVDGYNIGVKYQCVEFVKRYYYEYYHHKMPDAYGNAKDFFDNTLADSSYNVKRDLMQFTNPSISKPQVGDLLIYNGHAGNSYGHVAIVSKVDSNSVEIIQQNPGPFAHSRISITVKNDGGKYYINHERILGWLRMKETLH